MIITVTRIILVNPTIGSTFLMTPAIITKVKLISRNANAEFNVPIIIGISIVISTNIILVIGSIL
jgi:hypothetical protein